MNDLPTSSPQSEPAAHGLPSAPLTHAESGAGAATQGSANKRITLLSVLVVIMLVAMVMQWWHTNNEQSMVRNEVARRLQKDDSLNSDTRLLVKALQEDNKELQAKVSVLESKQQEAQSQQLALSQLYQDLSKNRDDWTLSGIEQTLSTANEQLQLAGNVQGALIALQNAERNLSASDRAQFFPIRKAIARDIEKLKAVPSVDISSIAVKLDAMIDEVDALPLLSGEQTPPQERNPNPGKATQPQKSVGEKTLLDEIKERVKAAEASFLSELSQLVQIRNVESRDALLLSPGQSYYLRENIKLSLLNARLALLTRNEATFKSDLTTTLNAVNKYFDPRSKAVRSFQGQLKTFMSTSVVVNLPGLNDSLSALNKYKAKP